MRRRVWLLLLCLYAAAAAADFAVRSEVDRRAGRDWLAPASLAVTFSAALFWPVDLVAQAMLAR